MFNLPTTETNAEPLIIYTLRIPTSHLVSCKLHWAPSIPEGPSTFSYRNSHVLQVWVCLSCPWGVRWHTFPGLMKCLILRHRCLHCIVFNHATNFTLEKVQEWESDSQSSASIWTHTLRCAKNVTAVNVWSWFSFSTYSFPYILLPVYKRKAYFLLFLNHDTLPWGFKKYLSVPKRQSQSKPHSKPEVSFCAYLTGVRGKAVLEMYIFGLWWDVLNPSIS